MITVSKVSKKANQTKSKKVLTLLSVLKMLIFYSAKKLAKTIVSNMPIIVAMSNILTKLRVLKIVTIKMEPWIPSTLTVTKRITITIVPGMLAMLAYYCARNASCNSSLKNANYSTGAKTLTSIKVEMVLSIMTVQKMLARINVPKS